MNYFCNSPSYSLSLILKLTFPKSHQFPPTPAKENSQKPPQNLLESCGKLSKTQNPKDFRKSSGSQKSESFLEVESLKSGSLNFLKFLNF